MTKNEFEIKLNEYISCVNLNLDTFLPSDGKNIDESMRYSVFAGGKRIRPVLVLASAEICGADYKKAVLSACAIELIHTYSLIYDDLPCMDNDILRRGRKTNHIVFGENIALMAGMGLYSRAFEIIVNNYKSYSLSEKQVIESINALLNASGMNGIVLGQVLDIYNVSSNQDVDKAYIEKVHNLKTSAMLEASAILGCIAADADNEKRHALHKYSKLIGLAFQIRDDILDVIGTKENMGKSIGKDKNSEKITFVDILGLENAQEKVKELTEEAENELKIFKNNEFLIQFASMLCSRVK